MTPEKITTAIIGSAIAIIGSLVGYVFYGHIKLENKVEKIETKQEQINSELDALWIKHNKRNEEQIDFGTMYFKGLLDNEKRWTQFYKEQSK